MIVPPKHETIVDPSCPRPHPSLPSAAAAVTALRLFGSDYANPLLFVRGSVRMFPPDFLGLCHHQEVESIVVGRGQQNLDEKSERGGQ